MMSWKKIEPKSVLVFLAIQEKLWKKCLQDFRDFLKINIFMAKMLIGKSAKFATFIYRHRHRSAVPFSVSLLSAHAKFFDFNATGAMGTEDTQPYFIRKCNQYFTKE